MTPLSYKLVFYKLQFYYRISVSHQAGHLCGKWRLSVSVKYEMNEQSYIFVHSHKYVTTGENKVGFIWVLFGTLPCLGGGWGSFFTHWVKEHLKFDRYD